MLVVRRPKQAESRAGLTYLWIRLAYWSRQAASRRGRLRVNMRPVKRQASVAIPVACFALSTRRLGGPRHVHGGTAYVGAAHLPAQLNPASGSSRARRSRTHRGSPQYARPPNLGSHSEASTAASTSLTRRPDERSADVRRGASASENQISTLRRTTESSYSNSSTSGTLEQASLRSSEISRATITPLTA